MYADAFWHKPANAEAVEWYGDLVTLGEIPDPQRFLDAGWTISESGGLLTAPGTIDWVIPPDLPDMTGGEGGVVVVNLEDLPEEDLRYLRGEEA